MQGKDQVLEVWGELACFTRPEMKVERFSYPFITPSAARGIFEAIYAKPSRDGATSQFRWQVTQIEILQQPQYIALRRNEVKDKAPSDHTIAQWMSGKAPPEPLLADADQALTGSDQKGRTQRQTMALRDVRYRIHARVEPWPDFAHRLQEFEAQFRRRAGKGKCFYQPYFGCREFPAYFELVEPHATLAPPIDYAADVGLMVYDVFDLSAPGTSASSAKVSLFRPMVRGGVVDVPPYDSQEVLRMDGGRL